MISVIITTYKRKVGILQRAIKSVLAQTYRELELIVVDDSPATYAYRETIRKYVTSISEVPTLYIQHEKNMGACVARNTGHLTNVCVQIIIWGIKFRMQEVSVMAVKQTAGREKLGTFAPKFAELNDDVLFGEVWSREDTLSLRERSLVTVVSLMAQGLVDSSFQYHLMTAKKNGITKAEIAEILTHAAFYAGWSKAWAAFNMAKEVWAEDETPDDAKAAHE